MRNNRRFDLSNNLIHFFRPLVLDNEDAPVTPENWGPGDLVEDTTVSPMFLLRNCIRTGRLWAGWSMRNGSRTIYGPDPAVCFTDMPLAAFIEAGNDRQRRGQAMSPYGLVLPKSAMFRIGTRPAIYGLSSARRSQRGEVGDARLLPTRSLPLREQYRYVAYSPGRIDWTHEREWRWPCRDHERETDEFGMPPVDGSLIPGLDLFRKRVRGIGAVVRTTIQAKRLIRDTLTFADRTNETSSRLDFVIARDKLPDLDRLRDPAETAAAVRSATFNLHDFQLSKADFDAYLADFHRAVRSARKAAPADSRGRDGGCWLWLTNNTQGMVRALVAADLVRVDADGRYLVQVRDFDPEASLEFREGMIRRLAELLGIRHGTSAVYHVVTGSDDPDGLPSYSNPPLNDRFHYNHGSHEDDF